jgi:hypothetical protein
MKSSSTLQLAVEVSTAPQLPTAVHLLKNLLLQLWATFFMAPLATPCWLRRLLLSAVACLQVGFLTA